MVYLKVGPTYGCAYNLFQGTTVKGSFCVLRIDLYNIAECWPELHWAFPFAAEITHVPLSLSYSYNTSDPFRVTYFFISENNAHFSFTEQKSCRYFVLNYKATWSFLVSTCLLSHPLDIVPQVHAAWKAEGTNSQHWLPAMSACVWELEAWSSLQATMQVGTSVIRPPRDHGLATPHAACTIIAPFSHAPSSGRAL